MLPVATYQSKQLRQLTYQHMDYYCSVSIKILREDYTYCEKILLNQNSRTMEIWFSFARSI